jgi:hypothetical protein
MRLCENEEVTVYEAEDTDLAELLVAVAIQVKVNMPDVIWNSVNIATDLGDGPTIYRATLYAHS